MAMKRFLLMPFLRSRALTNVNQELHCMFPNHHSLTRGGRFPLLERTRCAFREPDLVTTIVNLSDLHPYLMPLLGLS